MTIFNKLTEETVAIPLMATTKEEALKELVGLLKKAGRITDKEEAYKAVLTREYQGSTGLGEEIAIPHAKSSTVADTAIAIGISRQGIEFNSLDGKPVKMLFLILANPEQSAAHIEALSDIAKLTRHQTFRKTLLAADNAKEVVALFHNDD